MNPITKFLYNRKSARLYKLARKTRRIATRMLLDANRAYKIELLKAESLERLARACGRKARLGNKSLPAVKDCTTDIFTKDIIAFPKAS